jgi:NAD(P)-dependent dehydrogenase (short-subunit alcohol dehydrogenase family)
MNNKNILIFGGSKGIGRVFADRRIEKGDNVYVFSRTWMRRDKKEPIFIRSDFTKLDSFKDILKSLLNDIKLVNSILFAQRYRGDGDSWENEKLTSIDLFKEVVELVYPYLSRNSSIVAITSNAAKYVAIEQHISYHVAKAAVEQMVRYYAVKFASEGIRVNAVAPAITLKPENMSYYNKNKDLMELFSTAIPLGRMCKADDVCNVIDFLLSEQSSFVTGQVITVDGGLSLLTPEVLLRNMRRKGKNV